MAKRKRQRSGAPGGVVRQGNGGTVGFRRQTVTVTKFSGPLPSPEMLEKYNELIPNGAERIMALTERQSDHRQALERHVVHSNSRAQLAGMIFALIVVLAGLGGGLYLIVHGFQIEGYCSMFAPLGVVAGIFVIGRQQQSKERAAKRDDNQPDASKSSAEVQD